MCWKAGIRGSSNFYNMFSGCRADSEINVDLVPSELDLLRKRAPVFVRDLAKIISEHIENGGVFKPNRTAARFETLCIETAEELSSGRYDFLHPVELANLFYAGGRTQRKTHGKSEDDLKGTTINGWALNFVDTLIVLFEECPEKTSRY